MYPLDLSQFLAPLLQLAETAQPHNTLLSVNIIQAIRENDIVGLFCLSLTAVFSIISWAVIIYKYLHLRQAHRQTQRYVELCADSGKLDDAFRYAGSFPDSPIAQIARETYLEITTENWFESAAAEGVSHHMEVARISLERIHDRTITGEIRHLESWLIFLATTSTVAPFIGLFGTVWGILGVFQSLGTYSTVNIAVIAPGIATALTTTVGGLIAAIPAVVFYNYFTNSVQILVSRMDAYALELSNIAQKQILGG